jgi:hypothetical protein
MPMAHAPHWTRTSWQKPGWTWGRSGQWPLAVIRLSASLRTLTAPDVLPGALTLAARQLAQPRFDATYAAPYLAA